jgi:SAM-dependent methyltransferase
VNVFNKHYNPEGSVLPEQFKFPYSDSSFDFVYLISVFTDMLPEAVRNYIAEIVRVLKPGAKSFISIFLLNDSSRRVVADGKAKIPRTHERGDYAVGDPAFPESAIGLSEDLIRRYYDEVGLEIRDTHFGSWRWFVALRYASTETLRHEFILGARKQAYHRKYAASTVVEVSRSFWHKLTEASRTTTNRPA